ncbi:hypothetical protein PPL_05839 [Heterostelium album PN500]|uniref:Uncharacterized protein n=1 Tax=Heterostelium pallidum (strain ATCC 26659 / Pp 5 / PN500) TaxID=670386 RepID=D3BBH1_HETP5|nr:hypothetical protein PPL_05839 [Heterostelium album PN500]EFA81004.1 hypothetical protein PPL_05839 [Heterostelium album PN500]|eukprot:XP_020433122.1 hypothetical protein PPL_05839 [Heterostelium album PN500]
MSYWSQSPTKGSGQVPSVLDTINSIEIKDVVILEHPILDLPYSSYLCKDINCSKMKNKVCLSVINKTSNNRYLNGVRFYSSEKNNDDDHDHKSKVYQLSQHILKEKSDFEQQQQDRQQERQRNTWKSIIMRNAISFGVFGIFSIGIAAYLAGADDTEYMIKYADRVLDEISNSSEFSIVESKLKLLSECSSNNDTIKKILSSKKNINQLLDIIENYSNMDLNIYAVKIIENSSLYSSLIPRIVNLSMTSFLPVYVRKSLGIAITRIATHEDARVSLANAGAITALEQLNSVKLIKSQAYRTALLLISDTCSKHIDQLIVTDEELTSIKSYALEEKEIQSSTLQSTKRQLVESGWLLYFHTSAGGFVWGMIESWRNELPLRAMLKNGFRTSIVTAAVPIFFVGAMTTLYNNYRKQLDTTKEKFYFYLAGIYSLYPWYYILPKIEKYAPYWIGGHVLGFMSFFTWLVYTKNEIFNSDSLIIQKDKAAPPREQLIKMMKKENQMLLIDQQQTQPTDNNKKK